jgi:dUTPase
MVTVKRGDRIAQLVLERIMTPVVIETEVSPYVVIYVGVVM